MRIINRAAAAILILAFLIGCAVIGSTQATNSTAGTLLGNAVVSATTADAPRYRLDIVMAKTGDPAARCDHMGGRFANGVCEDVDH